MKTCNECQCTYSPDEIQLIYGDDVEDFCGHTCMVKWIVKTYEIRILINDPKSIASVLPARIIAPMKEKR